MGAVGLLASCSNNNTDFSTVANPASVKLEWRGSGMKWDRFQLVSAQVDPDAIHRARGSQLYRFDPGPRELGFQYFGNRGTFGNMVGNMKTAEVWKTKVNLEAGRGYLVTTAVDDEVTHVKFEMKEEASGKVVARSRVLPLRQQAVEIGPMPYMYVPVY